MLPQPRPTRLPLVLLCQKLLKLLLFLLFVFLFFFCSLGGLKSGVRVQVRRVDSVFISVEIVPRTSQKRAEPNRDLDLPAFTGSRPREGWEKRRELGKRRQSS